MSFKFGALLAAIFTGGLLVQSYTNFGTTWLTRTPRVYSDPAWYTVTRESSTLHYQAEGERLIECQHRAPLMADFLDKYGHIVSRELVRRGIKPDVKMSRATKPSDGRDSKEGEIVGTPLTPSGPRKFVANQLIIVTDDRTLADSINFVVKTECYNPKDGRVTGLFGPFPIPLDGKTIGYYPDVLKQPILTDTLPKPENLE